MDEIRRMQQYLLLIRRTVGWTAEDFGEKIGVTRQTINNIESGRNKLTKTQYIAMRAILDAEIKSNPDETQMLRTILDVFVDHPEYYKDSEREKLLSQANLMAPAILSKASTRKEVSNAWISAAKLILGSAIPLLASTFVTSAWLSTLFSEDDKKG